jgi:isoquinoline 1-oxidoreductase beta subunit
VDLQRQTHGTGFFGTHLTGGSNSIKHSFTQYRELGARTRGDRGHVTGRQTGMQAGHG